MRIDGHALFILFKKGNQQAYDMMCEQCIDPIMFMTEWFMCVYARTLPWCTVLRVWDMFFCEGIQVLYRVGLYLISSAFRSREMDNMIKSSVGLLLSPSSSGARRNNDASMYELLSSLQNLPIACLKESELVKESCAVKFSESDLKRAIEASRLEVTRQIEELNANRDRYLAKQNSKT